jgi:uncharacterized membrane protein YdbT with pleckstrin-like domain
MKYYSKIDLWYKILILIVIIILIASLVMLIFTNKSIDVIFAGIIIVLILAFILSITFNTYYEFKDDYLYCRSGIFSEKIKYKDIKSVKKSNNMFSSMALSRDRIEIKTSNNIFLGLTYISPFNQDEFMEMLSKRIK